jgi:hypothetical protein
MKNVLVLWVRGMTLIAVSVVTACGDMQFLPPEKTNRLVVSYEVPTKPAHQQIHDLLKKRQLLEKLKDFLSPFRLRWPLYMSLTECGGEADAYYGDDKIRICYEYIEELWRHMPAQTTPAGIEPIDTVIGPFFDTVLHEFAHALFDYLDVPVLGREEDAADYVSAYIYLNMGEHEARRLIMGAVYNYRREVEGTTAPSMAEFASEHSTPEQRAFNLLCIAYGANPELFEEVVKIGELPEERIAVCEEEYKLLEYAYETLIGSHIDPALAKEVFDRTWLPEKTSSMLRRGLN